MQYNSIVKDYMDDWTQRTANAACISFTKPSRQGMMLLCTDPQLKTVTENIAEKKEFYCTDVPLSGREIKLCFRLSFAKDEMMQEIPDVLVTDIPAAAEKFRTKCAVLYTGRIFGAGFIHSKKPSKNSATAIHDVFGAAFFMAGKNLKNGVYYAGFGGCNVKAKSLVSGGYVQAVSYDDVCFMMNYQKAHPDKIFCFDNTYGGRLADLHRALFLCLDEFDRICKAHDINYFLGGGSLLGDHLIEAGILFYLLQNMLPLPLAEEVEEKAFGLLCSNDMQLVRVLYVHNLVADIVGRFDEISQRVTRILRPVPSIVLLAKQTKRLGNGAIGIQFTMEEAELWLPPSQQRGEGILDDGGQGRICHDVASATASPILMGQEAKCIGVAVEVGQVAPIYLSGLGSQFLLNQWP